ncbi:MAG TPA: penicillin-binding protein 2 [Candidatus Eremiobacteraceae bacterium]|nr:penicillin-binding protein 2 [Candidatus Eremiobacteraceae bacterium]
MRRRLGRIVLVFIALFVLLAVQEVRVQIIQRTSIAQRAGNPRRSLTNEFRGALLDASGAALALTKGTRRVYPAGPALAQLVGYSSPFYGESGLESALDSVLAAPLQSAGGADVSDFFRRNGQTSTRMGGDVVLTLRADIARAADAALPPDVRGAAIVMDPRSGAILAAVNRPTFDPNTLNVQWRTLRSNPNSPLLDRAFAGLYPPGSTFKMVTASAALDSGVVVPTDTFVDPGYFSIGPFRVENDKREITGTQDMINAFALSSNVDFAQIGLRLGLDGFYDYLHRFHVGDDPQVAVPAARDEVPPKESVSPSELAQMSFGQGGLAVTPLRMALVASTIANGGVMMRPQLVKQFRYGGGGHSVDVPPVVWERVMSQTTADEVRTMMIAVVRNGTGTAARIPGVTVAGKTGTGTHTGAPPDAWFVCFAPAEHPRLVVAVIVEDAGYGGTVSAPIARAILADALKLYRQ